MSMYPIASISIGSGGGTPIFNNIPQTFKHLQVRVYGRGLFAGNAQSNLYTSWYNSSDTGLVYSNHRIQADGTSVVSGGNIGLPYIFGGTTFPAATAGANMFGAVLIDILDYTSTSKYKTVRILGGTERNGSGTIVLSSGMVQTLNPITNGFVDTEGTFAQYTRADLYGLYESTVTGV